MPTLNSPALNALRDRYQEQIGNLQRQVRNSATLQQFLYGCESPYPLKELPAVCTGQSSPGRCSRTLPQRTYRHRSIASSAKLPVHVGSFRLRVKGVPKIFRVVFGKARIRVLRPRIYRSCREISSLRIIAFSVVRCNPRRVAAVVTTPPDSRKTFRI
jgi:hypothetical protein